MSQEYSKGKVLTLLLIGLTSFGFAPILVRFTPETSPLVLVSYRTVFAVLMLVPYWLYKRQPARGAIDKDKLLTALAGVCLGLHFTFWIASLYYTSVASASVLVTIHPIIMILTERLWLKRNFAMTTWIGVMMAFAGSVLLGISDSRIEQDFADPLFGNMLAVTAAIIFVIYLLIGQRIRKTREWIDYVFPVYVSAAVTCVTLALLFGKNLLAIDTIGIAVGAGLAFGPQIMGHGSMNYAVKYVSPTLISTLVLAEPALASVMAFFLFDELPPVASIAAMVIILAGVGLTWKRKSGKQVENTE